ncbi:hypothetical protein BE18_04150 [Sorangium cellulosum]|uniref:RHS repeat-associated core domain-containing protein n=1 Tax=Sorangium cellulosum TaxID=56 RepID=A0A150S9X8_SORCE|nr:hypothetical protein BE18_04150 [Sorangium cellulosum]
MTFAYDDGGRTTSKTAGDGRSWRFDWGDGDLLQAVWLPDGRVVRFVYDPFARRLEKRVEKDRVVESITRYAWSGDALVHEVRERTGAGDEPIVEERAYAVLPEAPLPLADRVRRGEHAEVRYYVEAPNGMPEALLTGDGALVGTVAASLFGRVEGEQAGLTPLRFPGQYADEETGLYYNRYRYYDPETGQYLSPEPIRLGGSLRSYSYANGQPLDAMDPTGLNPVETRLTRTDGTEVPAFSGQAQGVAPPNYRPANPMGAQLLHPAVAASLPPNNAREVGVGGGPESCGEPLALSRHLYDWEKRNKPKRCNPPDGSWQQHLQSALGEVQSIRTNEDKGRGGPMDACPNCGQTIPRLWSLAGLPPPNGIYNGGVANATDNPSWNASSNQGQRPSTVTFNDPRSGAPIEPGAYKHMSGAWVRI